MDETQNQFQTSPACWDDTGTEWKWCTEWWGERNEKGRKTLETIESIKLMNE